MTVPGFTAEAGLYRRDGNNQLAAEYEVLETTDPQNMIQPQLGRVIILGPIISLACWIICRAAGGTRKQCLEFCAELTTIFD
jgi:hypothetical protein